MNYGLPLTYTPNLTPKYFIDDQYDGKYWQPDVLPIAAHIGRAIFGLNLVDIGCGRGHKLMEYAEDFNVFGIDYGQNIDYARKKHGTGSIWIDCNLEHQHIPLATIPFINNTVFVCSDVIEHLVNPVNLITNFLNIVLGGGTLVLTTPDRERIYDYANTGEPENPSHVREWTLTELRNWLALYSLHPVWQGWTLNNNVERKHSTILMIFGTDASAVDNLQANFSLERVP